MWHHLESHCFRIAYDVIGQVEPIILLHGFAANRGLNWRLTGWYEAPQQVDFA